MMKNISVIGAGSWGTTLANLLAEKELDVTLWSFEENVAHEINSSHTNVTYLPGADLSSNIKATSKMTDAVSNAGYIVNVVPTQFTRSIFQEAAHSIPEDAVIINASKGIEHGTLLTVSSILKETTGRRAAVISGPSFAKEVVRKLPTAVTLATDSSDLALHLQEVFNTGYFRVYTHTDTLGVELGGALKNVIAIASGISDGLGLGHNARAALITRGLSEIVRLGSAMGADPKTFSGLSGLGDLVLTCTGPLSRNYTVGVNLGEGMTLRDILASTKSVAEGVATALSAYDLSMKYNVDMPIIEQVYQVIYKDKSPAEAVRLLMKRSLKSEF